LPTASLHLRHRLFAGSVPGHRAERWNRQVSRVPLHDVGVTAIVETCTVSSEGVTPHSSLLRTHAPILSGSPLLRPWPRSRSLCRLPSAPAAGRIFPTLFCESFLGCLVPCHGGPTECIYLFLPLCHRPSPGPQRIGFPLLPAKQLFRGSLFEGCRHFITFKPPSLLASQVVPTAVHTATWQLRLLGPGRTCFVASARTGHANRPNTGN